MSPEQLVNEKVLLKKPWELIKFNEEGLDRAGIKIKGNSLFVNNAKHASAQNSIHISVVPITPLDNEDLNPLNSNFTQAMMVHLLQHPRWYTCCCQ